MGLHPDETNPPKIQGSCPPRAPPPQKSGWSTTCVSCRSPGEDGKIGLIINIEAQSSTTPAIPW
ncbi:MAG: hypothetical protein ACLSHU_06560 [Oscillospiraceae bacterium]